MYRVVRWGLQLGPPGPARAVHGLAVGGRERSPQHDPIVRLDGVQVEAGRLTGDVLHHLLLAVALRLQVVLSTAQLPLPEPVDQEEEQGEGEYGRDGGGHQPQAEITDGARDRVVPLVTDPLTAGVANPE